MTLPGFRRASRPLLALVSVLSLTACARLGPNPTNPNVMGPGSPGDPATSRVGGDGGFIFTFGGPANRVDNPGVGPYETVNPWLWRGAVETLSAYPLNSADPFGGVIVTDWYMPESAAGQRFKDTIFIMGRDLRGDAIRVSVFHQVNRGGNWVDIPVSPPVMSELRNRILERARELRAQARAQG